MWYVVQLGLRIHLRNRSFTRAYPLKIVISFSPYILETLMYTKSASGLVNSSPPLRKNISNLNTDCLIKPYHVELLT